MFVDEADPAAMPDERLPTRCRAVSRNSAGSKTNYSYVYTRLVPANGKVVQVCLRLVTKVNVRG